MRSNKIKLRIVYSRTEKDFVIHYPRSADGHLIQQAILGKMVYQLLSHESVTEAERAQDRLKLVENSSTSSALGWYRWDWLKELGERGYDLTTFKLEVQIDLNRLHTDFAHLWNEFTPVEIQALAARGIVRQTI